MVTTATEAAIKVTTIFGESANNKNISYGCRNLSTPKT